MTPSKIWIFPAAVAALTIGHVGYKPKLTGEGFPFPPTYTVMAANETPDNQQSQVQSEENADESAKLGKSQARKQAMRLPGRLPVSARSTRQSE